MKYALTLGLCFLATGVFIGCGGGGGDGTSPPSVSAVFPGKLYSSKSSLVVVLGGGFWTLGSVASVVFEADAGTPFLGGTSATLEVEGKVVTDGRIDCVVPATGVETSFFASVTVVAEDGTVIPFTGPPVRIVAQRLTSFSPGVMDGSAPANFTATGDGFITGIGTQATVTFRALSGMPFHIGAGVTNTIIVAGSVDSDTQISGTLPYAGVLGPTPVTVTITLQDGTVIQGSGASQATVLPGTSGVQGVWTYESVPSTPAGIDYGAVSEKPIRGAKVQLVRAANGTVITTRTLDAAGAYSIDYSGIDPVFVRVLAETGAGHPPVRVEDNTSGDALWTAEGPSLLPAGTFLVRDYVAPLGWGGASYTGPRVSAPFALLDAAYHAMAAFEAVRTPGFTPCVVNWSPDNRPSLAYDVTTGEIGGSHFLSELYILGKEDVDTDEFDMSVVLHEWGHWLVSKKSRSDSIGGPHSSGDLTHPSVAFGEGIATAIGANLSPSSLYIDTSGPGQASAWDEDIEDNSLDVLYGNVGWASESSVFFIVYDIIDSVDEAPHDAIGLGLGPIYDALIGGHRTTPYATTIFSFLAALKADNPGSATAIDTLSTKHGVRAVADDRGSTETNDTGWSESLPVFHSVVLNGPSEVRVLAEPAPYNHLDRHRFFYFTADGGSTTITADTPVPTVFIDDTDIYVRVYHGGSLVGGSDTTWFGAETVNLPSTVAGDVYLVYIENISLSGGPSTFPVTVSVATP